MKKEKRMKEKENEERRKYERREQRKKESIKEIENDRWQIWQYLSHLCASQACRISRSVHLNAGLNFQ